jgi:hypothetical protein
MNLENQEKKDKEHDFLLSTNLDSNLLFSFSFCFVFAIFVFSVCKKYGILLGQLCL